MRTAAEKSVSRPHYTTARLFLLIDFVAGIFAVVRFMVLTNSEYYGPCALAILFLSGAAIGVRYGRPVRMGVALVLAVLLAVVAIAIFGNL